MPDSSTRPQLPSDADERARDALSELAASAGQRRDCGGASLAADEIVARAASSVTDPDAAAAFVASVGTDRLREAVAAMRAAGRREPAVRGRRALDAFRWVRWAGECERPHDEALREATADRRRDDTGREPTAGSRHGDGAGGDP